MTLRTTRTAAALLAAFAATNLAGSAQAVTPRQFSAGSLIIPMDNCWQGDIAQSTTPKEVSLPGPDAPYCQGGGGGNSLFANGARRSYGLVWHLLQAGVPLYWIINPNKTNVDDPDMTLDTSACAGGSTDAVRLVDQSVSASYCGLDQLNPKDIPVPLLSQINVAICNKNQAAGPKAEGTFPLAGVPISTVSYRGGPFVIDAKDAALARDVMAWYFAPPGPTSGVYTNPLSGKWADPTGGAAPSGASGQFIDPLHWPLHWSQYAPSAFVPLYPTNAFSFDIGSHSILAPCTDVNLCPFTTWDPISPSGHVDPYSAGLNEITYATVNVHQSQADFTAYVGQLITSPIPVIALAGLTDPLHLNTFRFYLEEAGLTFGPCQAVTGGGLNYLGPGAVAVPPAGPTTGINDRFFDPLNYPFPGNLTQPAAPYSLLHAQCAEGIASEDPDYLAFDSKITDRKYTAGPPLAPSLQGGPYGEVLDIIAPEVTAFQNLLLPSSPTTPGCGAARYSQLWIPHWDAYLQSGPLTAGDPLAAAEQSTGTCPPLANGVAPSLTTLPVPGQCPYNPQIVQTVLQDLPVFVAHGGNVLAECVGAASLEDATMKQLLKSVGIDQTPSNFMTEGQGAMTDFNPDYSYDLLNPSQPFTQVLQGAMLVPLMPFAIPSVSATTQCMVSNATAATTFITSFPPTLSKPLPRLTPIGYPGPVGTTPPFYGPVPGGPGGSAAALATQANSGGGQNLSNDPYHLVEYAPLLTNGGWMSQTTLADPFLQVGDFYFLGVFGATESFVEGANAGYTSGPPPVRLPNTFGYAYGGAGGVVPADTQVLIRGAPALTGAPATSAGPAAPADPSIFSVDGVSTTNSGLPTETVYGDYWVKNHNHASAGAGTTVYLEGDSFDGRPDGLRMVWSSILNMSFVPSDVELARSSPGGYNTILPATPDSYLIQGTFQQSNVDYGKYTPIFTSSQDTSNWIFPPERGHLRQSDLNTDSCFLPGGGLNPAGGPKCKTAVTGAVGASTTNFRGLTNQVAGFWDTSENAVGTTNSLLTDTLFPPVSNAPGVTQSHGRVIFTHLYDTQASPAIGLRPVYVDPISSEIDRLRCAMFPESTSCSGAACAAGQCIAFPRGTDHPASAIVGPLQCVSCQAQTGSILGSLLNVGQVGAITNQAVADMISVVEQATGGCTPLLQNTCSAINSPQTKCMDQCWSTCLSICEPPPASGQLQTNFPPYTNPACQQCGMACAASCNSGAPGCTGASCCGVNATLDITSFRETCYPSIGGIDHSTPVVVGAPPMALNEQLPLPATGSAGCRPTVAYVGAADGMLHAIYIAPPPPNDAAGNVCAALSGCTYQPGEEIWAFMPNQSLPVVHTGGNCAHALFVDGVPVVKDVYANFTTNPNNPPTWHTVLTETMGQGGNHLFALDVTDPLAPVRTSATGCALPITEASLHAAGTILWEQGDPLDPFDPKPYFDPAGAYAWTNGTPVFQDTVTEGPGFPATGLSPTNPPIGTYHHYLGQSSTVFIGTLLGSGAQQSVTYVAGQNGSASQIDGFGRHIPNLTHCSGGCSRKDFSSGGALGSGALDVSSQHGPQGEVVYAFDSASGVARTSQTALGLSVIQHFAELYSYAPGRSGGFNDIPAPVLGVSTSNHPAADLLLVPDLDGELWGLRPTTLTSVESYGSPPTPFPAFDVQRYGNAVAPRFKCAPSLGAPLPSLLSQAAFGNPGAVLPPGSCPGAGNGTNDTVVIYPTGGVDWGPAASVISAIDVSVDDFQINPNGTPAAPSGVAAAVANDGWAELMPVQTGTPVCTGIQTPTCEHAFLPSKCLGRVFGQPLVVGGDVFYTTSTGVLTGSGSSIDQQNGDGTISTLGGGSSACLSTDNCLCQTTETSVDLASNVGKVASGLSAIPLPAGGTTMQIFSASTTGLSSIPQVNVVQTATSLLKKLVLQQWWLRPQRPTPCAGTPGIPGCN